MSSEKKKMKKWHIFFGDVHDGILGSDKITAHPFLRKERTLTVMAHRVFLDGDRAIAYKVRDDVLKEEVIGVFSGVDHILSEDCAVVDPFTNIDPNSDGDDEFVLAKSSTKWINDYREKYGNGTKLYYIDVSGIPDEKIKTFVDGFRKGIRSLEKES